MGWRPFLGWSTRNAGNLPRVRFKVWLCTLRMCRNGPGLAMISSGNFYPSTGQSFCWRGVRPVRERAVCAVHAHSVLLPFKSFRPYRSLRSLVCKCRHYLCFSRGPSVLPLSRSLLSMSAYCVLFAHCVEWGCHSFSRGSLFVSTPDRLSPAR